MSHIDQFRSAGESLRIKDTKGPRQHLLLRIFDDGLVSEDQFRRQSVVEQIVAL